MTNEQITITGTVCTLVFALISGGFALYTYRRGLKAQDDAENAAIIRALQGEKESVIYIAHMAATGKLDDRLKQDPDFHAQLVHALCIAWPMESSSRVRSAIFKALNTLIHKECRAIITETLQVLHHSFRDYQLRFKDERIHERITLLADLCTQLGVHLPGDAGQTAELPKPPSGTKFSPPVSI